MLDIAVAGHLCLDLIPALGRGTDLVPGALMDVGPLTVSLGGSVANTGRALADLGATVIPSATIGADEMGTLLTAQLDAAGFTTPRLDVSATAATSYSLVVERPGEDRTFWHHTGANDEFDGSGVDVAGVGLLHVGYPSLLPGLLVDGGRPLRVMLERARAAGVTTSLDLAVVDPGSPAGTHDWRSLLEGALAHCDVVSPSLEDLTSALQIKAGYSPGLVNELAEWMLAAGAAVVAISAGHHGVQVRTGSTERLQAGGAVLSGLASWAEREFLVPPRPVTPRTTNGAGDASTAGLLFGLARSAEPALAGALAAACSAAVMIGERPTPRNVVRLDPALAPLVVTDGSAG